MGLAARCGLAGEATKNAVLGDRSLLWSHQLQHERRAPSAAHPKEEKNPHSRYSCSEFYPQTERTLAIPTGK